MGQKVHPHGIRLGIVKTWDAKWYADKDFATNLHEDIKIRKRSKPISNWRRRASRALKLNARKNALNLQFTLLNPVW